mgnify:CR=1 FL=1
MRARTCAPAALAVLLCGCFGTSWRQSAGVLKDMNTEVELERMFEAGTPKDAGFAHPADIPTEHLAAFVSRLAYEQPKLFGSTEYLPLVAEPHVCLLYTSDAADDLLCVDLGGRRIIKKQNQQRDTTHIHRTSITSMHT